MTRPLLLTLLLLLIINSFLAFHIGQLKTISARIAKEARAMVPTVSVVGILFGLFTSFTSADVNQRATALRLALDREVGAARSLVNITSGVGPTAEPIRLALVEYLQTVETTEWAWMREGAKGAAPADAPVYSLVLTTTVFAERSKGESAVKSLLLARVDELASARTERLSKISKPVDVALWIALVIMAAATQLTGGIALSGARLQACVFLAAYTVVAVAALAYLGLAGGLLADSALPDRAAAFSALKAQAE